MEGAVASSSPQVLCSDYADSPPPKTCTPQETYDVELGQNLYPVLTVKWPVVPVFGCVTPKKQQRKNQNSIPHVVDDLMNCYGSL